MKKEIAYKGFNKNLTCRDFQYKEGETYIHNDGVEICKSGFHSCKNPIDVFSYYDPVGSVFHRVEISGSLSTSNGDTKIASSKITIKASMDIPEIVLASIKWIVDNCKKIKSEHSKGDRSASSATGDQSASSATGYQSASSATGDQSASSATGYRSASSATGYRSASSATGYRSASSATGDQSASSATGYQSASSATGDQSASSATGYRSASSATGDQSASSATGYRSASSATGYRSASSATGYRSASSATGKNSVAMNIGVNGKAMADKNGAIVLCNHDSNYNIRHIRAAKVGENGIKINTWYELDINGDFVEV